MAGTGVCPSTDAGYFEQTRPEVAPFLPTTLGRVLEVGCSSGGFSHALVGASEVWGIEPYSEVAVIAAKRYHKVLVGTFDSVRAELPTDYFNTIVCNDVIEHMPSEERFLTEIRAHMARDSVIVGSIPNVRFYDNMFQLLALGEWEYTESGILDRTHLRFFTRGSWERTLHRNGFLVEQIAGINDRMRFGRSRHDRAAYIFGRLINMLTLGSASDMRFLQFGFRARLQSKGA